MINHKVKWKKEKQRHHLNDRMVDLNFLSQATILNLFSQLVQRQLNEIQGLS